MEEIFYDIFQDLPRQGPGDEYTTYKAIQNLPDLPKDPTILDVGCGTGFQTLQLAHHFGGNIYALDNYGPYLEQLTNKAEELGFGDEIIPVQRKMDRLDFEKGFFDLIWAEASIYIMGFEEGLRYLKQFLKPGGSMAVSEICWTKDNPPQELVDFWRQEYEDLKSVRDNLNVINNLGFEIVEYFMLTEEAWWNNYYHPLEHRLNEMRVKYADRDDALELIEYTQFEIDVFRKYPEYYGYVFFIFKNTP